ncbi:hypothetical protein [Alloprevotella sp. oral taxon 473]|uniref:hypothetical protein n=1 Tax=Alloprevotella sp. oral taxon 473 TaxID=712469 RepID=UPI0005C48B0C|nr:hypothetical protein [Alloprevotella sp. oral taxon 473]
MSIGFYVAYMNGIMYSPYGELANYLAEKYAPAVAPQNTKNYYALIDGSDCSEDHLKSLLIKALGNYWFEVTFEAVEYPYAKPTKTVRHKLHIHVSIKDRSYYFIDRLKHISQ